MKALRLLFLLIALATAHADTILNTPALLWTDGCGPTAAAMLMGYWNANGYSGLSDATTIDDLAQLMGTTNGWTYLYRVAPAMSAFTAERGYDFNSYSSGFVPWSSVTSSLDAGDPLLALVDTNGDNVTDHFVPVIGWQGTNFCYYTTWSTVLTCSPYQPMAYGQSWGVGYLTWLIPESGNVTTSPPEGTPAVPEPTTLVLLAAGLAWFKIGRTEPQP